MIIVIGVLVATLGIVNLYALYRASPVGWWRFLCSSPGATVLAGCALLAWAFDLATAAAALIGVAALATVVDFLLGRAKRQ